VSKEGRGVSDNYRGLAHFLEAEAFRVGSYPGDPDDLVVHLEHLRSYLRSRPTTQVLIRTKIVAPFDPSQWNVPLGWT
jgi:hypothetical protein